MCDTFVALPSVTSDGSIIFGKNSDREPNEAQALEFIPAMKYEKGTKLKATYITIPQATMTYAVLLCRPFWMWGAEIGANEKGVVIGNEAVWTKMPLKKKGGLTGMDLLRLALERGRNAQEAIHVIVQMLVDFGQGGICGYYDKKMVYHNSYIIADPKEAWVLETAAHLWVARKIRDMASISNGLTIGAEFDLHHPELIPYARKKGWLKKGEEFHFNRIYRDWFYTTFSASRKRQCRSLALLKEKSGSIDIPYAFRILRDHDGGKYQPDKHFLGNRICAHAANPLARKSTQTTASLVAHLKPGDIGLWVTGTSAPCTGIFKPVWFERQALPDIPDMKMVPGKDFDPNTLWWRHEVLHREVLRDFQSRLNSYAEDRDELEAQFLSQAASYDKSSRATLTQACFSETADAGDHWLNQVKDVPVQREPNFIYRWFWNKQKRGAGIPV
jgi:dipeptidase